MLKHYHNVQLYKVRNFVEHVSADAAGSAEMVSKNKNKDAAIASTLSAKIWKNY